MSSRDFSVFMSINVRSIWYLHNYASQSVNYTSITRQIHALWFLRVTKGALRSNLQLYVSLSVCRVCLQTAGYLYLGQPCKVSVAWCVCPLELECSHLVVRFLAALAEHQHGADISCVELGDSESRCRRCRWLGRCSGGHSFGGKCSLWGGDNRTREYV